MDDLYGEGLLGETLAPSRGDRLSERFLIPPFSVVSAREGYWQTRKRAWLSIGIQSELGRGEALIGGSSLYSGDDPKYGNRGPTIQKVSPGGSPRPAMDYSQKQRGDGSGRPMESNSLPAKGTGNLRTWGLTPGAYSEAKNETASLKNGLTSELTIHPYDGKPLKNNTSSSANAMRYAGGFEESSPGTTGTSIFDPVLCELAYKWFCPPGGQVIDPFSGGSVRGIVASRLGLSYTGVDLSEPQIKANRNQGTKLCPGGNLVWHCGDSANIGSLCADVQADMIFSCPPYGNLERYSNDPRDISTMTVDEFKTTYEQIISETCKLLKPNRFACFVVGDYRDKEGFYCNLPGVTIEAFAKVGLRLYNYGILITAAGSLPIRVSAHFSKGRKLGKTHQDILIFVKGDPKKAADACGVKVD